MPRHSCVDELDLKIIDALLANSRITFKELAKSLGVDQRLVSSRVDKLIEEGILENFTVEVNWRKLGFGMQAIMCLGTGSGKDLTANLHKIFKEQPRIVRAEATSGGYEYVIQVVCKDQQDLRTNIGYPLESLTTNLSTSIVSDLIKRPSYKPLLAIAKELCSSSLDKPIKKGKAEAKSDNQ